MTDEFLNPTRPSLETGPYGTREQQLLLDEGRIDEAEKYALAARETVSAEDIVSRATTRVALAQVRAAQGRNEEAETLFSEALEIVSGAELCRILLDVLPPYAEFLRALDREAEAVVRAGDIHRKLGHSGLLRRVGLCASLNVYG